MIRDYIIKKIYYNYKELCKNIIIKYIIIYYYFKINMNERKIFVSF